MIIKLQRMIIMFLSILLLVACGVGETTTEEDNHNTENSILTSISELKNTETFRKGALEHILEGELNARGKAVGFHYDGMPTKKGEVIPGTESKPNKVGVYEAKVEVKGVSKTSNNGKSTFFPKDWHAQQVIDAINEAYSVKSFISGNTYEGLTSEGQIIRMYLDNNDQIISAFPVY